MRRSLLVLYLLLANCAFADLNLFFHPGPGVEQPVGDSIDLGSVPTGDLGELKLRLRNLEAEAVTLTQFRVTGTGFALDGHPTIPYTVTPGTNVDFRVQFRPVGPGSYSGVLRVNDTRVMLFGTSPETLELSVASEEGYRVLSSGQTIIFGRVDFHGRSELAFRIENPSRHSLNLERLETLGDEFKIRISPPPPLRLAPGKTLDFSIEFAPLEIGIRRATLWMNDRDFTLEGVGLAPPFSEPEIQLTPQTLASGQQGSVSIHFSKPSPAAGTGTLTLEFQPSIEGAPDDPAVQFPSTGNRSATFAVAEGETVARFDGLQDAVFQTGTTAGEITFKVELGDRHAQTSAALPPVPVTIDDTGWRDTSTGGELTIRGFDNTRSASEVSFQFFDTAGKALTAEPIRVPVADSFRQYYSVTSVGGVFSLLAAFPVAGDASLLGAVEIEFANMTGPSETHRLAIH